jgi:phosphohistidine swiveling domain-containing protein
MSFRICDAAPESGFWRRETAHYPSGISRHLWELLLPDYIDATRRTFKRYGSAIDHMDVVRIRGRIYNRPVFVEDEREIKERNETAKLAIAGKLWRADRDAWSAMCSKYHNQLTTLSRLDPKAMAPAALLKHLADLRVVFHNGTQAHFELQPSSTIPVGDWLRETSEKGEIPVTDIALFLRGQTRPADFVHTLDELVEQIQRSPGQVNSVLNSSRDPAEILKCLGESSSDLSRSLAEYMDEFGDRIVTGFDLIDVTLREMPGVFLAVLRSKLNSASAKPSKRNGGEGMENLRRHIPPEYLNAFESGLQEAATAYGLHDEDVRITHLWPLGLIRRAMLAAANQLLSRGAIAESSHVFQTTPAELDALIDGDSAPLTQALAARAAEWNAWKQLDAPLTIGKRDDDIRPDFKPREFNRIDLATTFYLTLMESRDGAGPGPEWILVDGIAASPGRYEGQARVIREPSDFSKLKQGDVLVSRITSSAYNLVMPIIGAVVTDSGGALCHAAIVAREFGIPAVVGTNQATLLIPDGARVLVDGDRGFVAVRS